MLVREEARRGAKHEFKNKRHDVPEAPTSTPHVRLPRDNELIPHHVLPEVPNTAQVGWLIGVAQPSCI